MLIFLPVKFGWAVSGGSLYYTQLTAGDDTEIIVIVGWSISTGIFTGNSGDPLFWVT